MWPCILLTEKKQKRKHKHIFHTRCYKILLMWCILHASDSFKVRENQHGTQHVAVLMLQRSKCKEIGSLLAVRHLGLPYEAKWLFKHTKILCVCICVYYSSMGDVLCEQLVHSRSYHICTPQLHVLLSRWLIIAPHRQNKGLISPSQPLS